MVVAVKAKSVFFMLLSCVLLLQGVWNVAAALCLHENTQMTTVDRSHFGHHVVTTSHNTLHTQLEKFIASEQHDHSDHLPSLNPIMLSQSQQAIEHAAHKYVLTRDRTDWENLYQSPDLAFSSPPPILTPL